jgi:hypothetical protein
MKTTLMGLAFWCALAQVAAAQTAAPLAKGTRVRVVVPAEGGQPERTVSGGLLSLQGDTASIWPDDSQGLPALAPEKHVLSGGRRLEVVAGTRGHAGDGFLLGTGIGALSGALIGFATFEPCVSTGFLSCMMAPQSRTAAAGMGAALGGVGGALLGLVFGAFNRTENWVPVRTAGVHVALTPRGIGLSMAF